MNKTKIDWCDYTWNPVWGCWNACPYCYARKRAKMSGMRICGRDDFAPTWIEKNFQQSFPRKPSRIFVNSMSDIAYWEDDWMNSVLVAIQENPQHTYLFLTQNSAVYDDYDFPLCCWLGVTITKQTEMAAFADSLFESTWEDKHLLFLSIEPMLEPIQLYVNPDWIILGAETGNRKDRVIPPPEWIEPFLALPIPLYMKKNLPWSGPWRKEFPV